MLSRSASMLDRSTEFHNKELLEVPDADRMSG